MPVWKINLDGYGDTDSGEVFTDNGEVIGTWTTNENNHCSFTPHGALDPLLTNPFVPMLCRQILAWHEGQKGA
jgi:hypothetical protein